MGIGYSVVRGKVFGALGWIGLGASLGDGMSSRDVPGVLADGGVPDALRRIGLVAGSGDGRSSRCLRDMLVESGDSWRIDKSEV